ncbi:hypothetical protein [Bacillus wiedmannii]|uniref:hypothetical protein n=1 Tax=Bacillus wiedmannii TaxID=1890302 RepID=UPI000BF0E13A|nr:hypothetical protein [Bacillus wiedmannii]PEO38305.1 hypothetical protein CN555_13945 [Bacillus wiedmannii]
MKTHVKTKEIFLGGKKYLVGSFLKEEELAMALRQGRKVLYAKSHDVYFYKDGKLRTTVDFGGYALTIIPFRTQYDVITTGAYKLIPAWMEA